VEFQCDAASLNKWSRIFQLSVIFTLQMLKSRAESESSWTLKTGSVKVTKSCKTLGTPDCSVIAHGSRNHFFSFGCMTTPGISAVWLFHRLLTARVCTSACSACNRGGEVLFRNCMEFTDYRLHSPVSSPSCVCTPSHTSIAQYYLTRARSGVSPKTGTPTVLMLTPHISKHSCHCS
jgi:hypothetical protein